MTEQTDGSNVVQLRKGEGKQPTLSERLWGKDVASHGYVAVPAILIQGQKRLGITPLQLNIVVQLLDYWRDPERHPFPSRRDIGSRIGVTEKTVQNNIRALEKAGLIQREIRRTTAGDFNSNVYHLDGLVAKLKSLEPDFSEAREKKRQAREAHKKAQTPKGQRLGKA